LTIIELADLLFASPDAKDLIKPLYVDLQEGRMQRVSIVMTTPDKLVLVTEVVPTQVEATPTED
jgi:hypothetical protein